MQRSKALTTLGLLALAACVVLYFFARVDGSGRPTPIQEVTATVPDSGSAPTVSVPSTALERTRVDEPTVRILVYRNNLPVDGAMVFVASPGHTRADEESREVIGTTIRGSLELPTAKLREWKHVVARYNGAHGHADIPHDGESTITINMPVGHSLSVRVVDDVEDPLPGCRVMIGRRMLPERTAFLDRSAVWDPMPLGGTDSIYGGVADEQGFLRISGLSVGDYQIDVRKFGYLPDVSCYEGASIPDRADVQISMRPVLAAAVVVHGDEIIHQRFKARISTPFFSGITDYLLEELKQGLRERFEGAIVAIGVGRGGRERTAVLECFGRTSGWSTHRVPLRPIAMLDQPTRIDIPVRGRDLTAEIVVDVRSAGGIDLEDVKLTLIRSGERTYERDTFSLRSGKPGRVPEGVYTLRAADALLRHVVQRDLQVRSGSNREVIELATDWRRVRLNIEKGGSRLMRGMVKVETAVGSRMIGARRGGPVWVPVGPVGFRAFLGTREDIRAETTVDRGVDVHVETILLQQ